MAYRLPTDKLANAEKQQARSEYEPARSGGQPGSPEGQPAKTESQPASTESQPDRQDQIGTQAADFGLEWALELKRVTSKLKPIQGLSLLVA